MLKVLDNFKYDLFAKFHDEEERPIARMLTEQELQIIQDYLLTERKRHFNGYTKTKHYVDYIRVE